MGQEHSRPATTTHLQEANPSSRSRHSSCAAVLPRLLESFAAANKLSEAGGLLRISVQTAWRREGVLRSERAGERERGREREREGENADKLVCMNVCVALDVCVGLLLVIVQVLLH